MGLFDKFLHKNTQAKENTNSVTKPVSMLPLPVLNQVKQIKSQNGRLYYQLDYYDRTAMYKQMYDTTRIIVDAVPTMIAGHSTYSAKVSWYGQNDAEYLDPQYGDMGRKNQFTEIKLGLDVSKFFSDPQYQDVLMRQLLEKKRVERYIGEGLKDNPSQPCGNYIGYVGYSIQSNSNEYKKIFSGSVGHEVHYSSEMITKREKHKQYQEKQKQAMIARKQEEINRLQEEIDTLEKT